MVFNDAKIQHFSQLPIIFTQYSFHYQEGLGHLCKIFSQTPKTMKSALKRPKTGALSLP